MKPYIFVEFDGANENNVQYEPNISAFYQLLMHLHHQYEIFLLLKQKCETFLKMCIFFVQFRKQMLWRKSIVSDHE